MGDNDLIQVLWVENDPLVTDSYPREAEMIGGLQLTAFSCWEEAEIALEKDYDKWQAIILDAKCQYLKGEADKALRFLTNAIHKIRDITILKDRTIPWYVLSGQGEDDIRDMIPEINVWDNDWAELTNRRFYSKNAKIKYGNEERHERQILFERIRVHVTYKNQELQIEKVLYPDVFKSLENLGLAGEVGFHLMALLTPIHFKGTSNSDYNHRYIDLRKSLEYIFRHMVKLGLLPSIVIAKEKKDQVNLSWSSLFLGAEQPTEPMLSKETEKKFWEKIERISLTPILPKQLSKWLKEAIFQTGGAAHTSEVETEIAINLDKYLPCVGFSSYMLRSLTMGLCDFILWYDNFIKRYPKKEINSQKFWKLRNEKI